MQFLILGNFNETFNRMSPAEQQEGMQAEWAKTREYYAKGLLRQIWVSQAEQSIISVFDAESREHMERLLADYPGMKAGFVTAEIRLAEPYGGFFPDLAK